MFDVNFKNNDITFASIEQNDIERIQNWINSEEYYYAEMGKKLDSNEFYEMFLEYYIGECEFFFNMQVDKKIIGICRGRIEFSNHNKVWIGYFIVDNSHRSKEKRNAILKDVLDYFKCNYGIHDFEAGIVKENKSILEKWKQSGFKILRVSKDFYDVNGEEKDMLVLKKKV